MRTQLPEGQKGLEQAMRKPSPILGMEERGILSQSSQTGSTGWQLAAVWLLC